MSKKAQVKAVEAVVEAKAETKAKVETKTTTDDAIREIVAKAVEKVELLRTKEVTGYTGIYYGNETLVELHFKKRSISHATFGQAQSIFEYLKSNKLITRIVPKSYGWKLDTECLMTKEFLSKFPTILETMIKDAQERQNLKNAKKDNKKEVANG